MGNNVILWYTVKFSKYKSILNREKSMNELDLVDQCNARVELCMITCCSVLDSNSRAH